MLLNKYPLHDSSRNTWIMILFFSLFIPVFLGVFQPFGISQLVGPNKPIILSGYGVMTFLTMAFYLFVVKKWFNEDEWNVAKEIILTLSIVLTIGLLNYLYSSRIFGFDGFDVKRLFVFIGYTITVGIMPIGFMVSVRQNLLHRVYARSADEMNRRAKTKGLAEDKGDDDVLLISGEYNDSLETKASNILYFESRGNYTIIYVSGRDDLQEVKIRGSLSKIKSQISDDSDFFQTHRAFIVNMKRIQSISGNAQGLRLTLNHIDIEVPVSRSYVPAFRSVYVA